MAKQKITYLLGAGASYNALPIIDELGGAFRVIGDLCKNAAFNGKPDEKKDFEIARKDFYEWMEASANRSIDYNTIDTYAKMLNITGQEDQLVRLKACLSMFFTVWQEIGNRRQLSESLKRKTHSDSVLPRCDTRFVSLLGNFLLNNKNEIQLDENIKFITWNYDIQLELGLKAYFDKTINAIISHFNIFPSNSTFDDWLPSVVHLNGIGGIYKNKSGYQSLFDRGNSPPRAPAEVFNDLLFFILESFREGVKNDELFSYAWENDSVSVKAVEFAERIMKNTDVLVIIGYSFPSFNQEIDRKLFEQLSYNGRTYKVYYQDPNADASSLATKMKISTDRIFVERNNLRQFILPHEYFG